MTNDGTLTASIAAGAVLDQYGYPSLAFSGSYITHIGTQAFPVPLTAVNPLGSLVYQGSRASMIAAAGVSERFTIALNPGQTLTALVTPAATLEPASRSPPRAGPWRTRHRHRPWASRPSPRACPSAEGTYTVTVGGAAGTGTYTLQLDLNAAVEYQSNGGPANNTLATAKSLNPAFSSMGTSAQRAAVLGNTVPAASEYYSMTVAAGQSLTAGLALLATGTATLNLYNGARTWWPRGPAAPAT